MCMFNVGMSIHCACVRACMCQSVRVDVCVSECIYFGVCLFLLFKKKSILKITIAILILTNSKVVYKRMP